MESSPDVGVSVAPALEINWKRLVTAEEDGDLLESSSPKRIRRANSGFEKDVKKVAEIVLVLSALGKMRGGKGLSEVEKELMEAARITLAKICEDFIPKEVFPKETFGALIEDLGLNKLKDQKLGSRSPKISIAEKLLASKKKMEKAEEFAIASAHSSHHQRNTMATGEGRSGLHSARTSITDKTMHVSISGGAFQLGRNSVVNSTSLSYQLPTSEIRPVHLSGTALPRDDGSCLRSANYSANSMVKTSTWEVQHATGVPLNLGSDDKVPVHGFVPQTTSRTFAAQTIGGLQPEGVNPAQTFSLRNTHVEIVKIVVQKLLKPKATENLTWDPPSRDYMNKALTCQICMSMATDVDSILICDACENGYHYAKCLGMKEVPQVEWHCAKCLSLSNGKPLPPKYGRVMRNANASKMPSTSETGPGSSTIQSDALDEKASQPRALVNGSAAMGSNSNVTSESPSGSNMPGSSIPNSLKPSNPIDTSRICDDITFDAKPNPPAEYTNFVDTSVDTANCLETRPLEESYDTHVDSKELQQNDGDLLNDNEVLHKYPAESILSSSNVKQDISSGTDTHAIHQWRGEPISISGDNYFYASCFINGHLYNTLDHALMRFDNGKLVPAKIQAFWEDKSSATNWVTVNQCYFPDDFPESVGRPCGLENNEVCESTSSYSCSISSIYSPCLVLPPRKFAEESKRRAHLAEQRDDHLPPVYLCKWVYDETKGLFRDASSFPSS